MINNTKMNSEYDYLFKILLIGDAGVGKSTMLLKFVDDIFTTSYLSTIGVDFKIKTIELDNKIIKLQIWDTAGQERFRTITSSYYRGAYGIFVVFDLTQLDTFTNVQMWLNEIEKYSHNPKIIIIGAKEDLKKNREVFPYMLTDIKEKYTYLEVSSLTGYNINEAFETMAYEIKQKKVIGLPPQNEDKVRLIPCEPPPTKTCC